MASLALPFLTTGISALAGLFGAKPKPVTTNSSSNSTSTSTPNIGANQQSLEDQFTRGITQQLNSANDMSGYTGQGLQQINQTAGVADKMSKNILAARGLSNSPYAATLENQNNNNRLNQSSQFLNQIPLLQQQLRQQAIQQAISGSVAIPYGSTVTGSSSGTSTQSGGGGSPVAGALSGAGAALNAPMGGGVSAGQQIATQLGNIFGGGPKASGASYYDPSEA
jgi:hypothetical protein